MELPVKEQFYGRSKETRNMLFYVLWLVSLWNVEKFEFPLNRFLEEFQTKFSRNLERVLSLVCAITGMDKILGADFVREATVIVPENPGKWQWDEETIWTFFAVLTNNRKLPPLNFSDIGLFRKALEQVFLKLLQEYTNQMLDARSACYWVFPDEPLAPLKESLDAFFREIYLMLPADTGLEPYEVAFKESVDQWLQKNYVKKPDFKRVVAELLD